MHTRGAAIVAAVITSVFLFTPAARASPELEATLSSGGAGLAPGPIGPLGTAVRLGFGDRVFVQTGLGGMLAGMGNSSGLQERAAIVAVPLEVVGELVPRAPSTFVPTLRLAVSASWMHISVASLEADVLCGSVGAYVGLRYYANAAVAIALEVGVAYSDVLDQSGAATITMPRDAVVSDVRLGIVFHP